MKKTVLVLVFGLWLAGNATAQQGPLSLADPRSQEKWVEKDGYAIVNDARLHYWLYVSTSGNTAGVLAEDVDLYEAFEAYMLKLGWTKAFGNDQGGGSYLNPDLAESVKNMMFENGAIVSVTIIEYGPRSAQLVYNVRYQLQNGGFGTWWHNYYK